LGRGGDGPEIERSRQRRHQPTLLVDGAAAVLVVVVALLKLLPLGRRQRGRSSVSMEARELPLAPIDRRRRLVVVLDAPSSA